MASVEGFGRRGAVSRPQPWRSSPPLVAAASAPQTADAPVVVPFVTCGVVAALTLIFILEYAAGFSSGAGLDMGHGGLIAFGGVSRELVFQSGEWWRLFTASLLHGNLPHILGNGVVLLLGGYYLERLIGHAWFAAVYVLSGLGGALASALLNDGVVVSVGASGAIMGVLAVLGVCSLHSQAMEQSRRIRNISLRLLIPSIIPYGSATGSPVDFNAHLGGATVGFVLGFILLICWPETGEPPRLRKAALVAGIAGLALGLASLALVAVHYPRYAAPARLLMSDAEARRDLKARPEAILALHPRDPRAHLAFALKLAELNPVAAEREARAGLRETDLLDHFFADDLRTGLQAVLAVSLMQQHRMSEAREAARPACADQDPDLAKMRKGMAKVGLCR